MSGEQMNSGSPRTDPNAVGGAASVADLSDVMVRREPSAAAPAVTATNVVPFARSRRETADPAPALAFDPSARPAPYRPRREQFALIAGLFVLSLLVHGVLYLLFNRQPEPMASIGLEAISVEIVLGAETPAGLGADTGPDTTQATPADDPDPTPTDVDTADPEPPKPVQTAETPADVTEAKPEQPSEPPPEPQEPQQAQERQQQQESQQQEAQQQEAQQQEPQVTAALSVEPPAREPVAAAPEEHKPDVIRPEPKPVAPRETRPKPKPDAKPKPQHADKRTRTASREAEATGPRANAAGGVGIGRSQNDTNYPGLVRAHLARYQRQAHTEQGRAVVTFVLDGGGRVTSVSVARSSGVASLDQEAQASVRRASPFPAPPNGRSASFTVPVNFAFR